MPREHINNVLILNKFIAFYAKFKLFAYRTMKYVES